MTKRRPRNEVIVHRIRRPSPIRYLSVKPDTPANIPHISDPYSAEPAKLNISAYLSLFKSPAGRGEVENILVKKLQTVLTKISAYIRLLPDDSGRFYYLDGMESSYSTLHSLLEYFIKDDDEEREVPIDAHIFLKLLKRAGVPAQLLRLVKRRRHL